MRRDQTQAEKETPPGDLFELQRVSHTLVILRPAPFAGRRTYGIAGSTDAASQWMQSVG
jgi:hypothetical protein